MTEAPQTERGPATGAQLTEKAWAIVTADRRLLLFPALATVMLGLASLVIAGVLLDRGVERSEVPFTVVVVTAIVAFPFTAVATFCNVAFLAMVEQQLAGEPLDARAALRLAVRRLPAILAWSAFAATVGALIRLVDRLPAGAAVVGVLQVALGLVWAASTMFVTPLLVRRPGSPRELLAGSVAVLRQRFGASVVGSVTIGTLGGICAGVLLAGACVGGAAVQDGVPLGAIFLVAGLLGGIFVLALTSATAETFHLVVYRYATTGEVAGTFTERQLAHDAMRHRGTGVTGWFRRVRR